MSIAAVLHGGPLLALRRCNLLLSCLRRGLAINVHLVVLRVGVGALGVREVVHLRPANLA